MPARFWILRIVIGLMCIGFAFFWGRSLSRKDPARRGAGPTAWAIRTLAAAAALLWGSGIDLFAIGSYLAAGLSVAGGYVSRPKPPTPEEDLTKQMFPDE